MPNENEMNSPVVVRPDGGEARWWFDGLATLKASGKDTAGRFALLEMLYPANCIVPVHVHHREDELFYVLEGELKMRIGGRPVLAGPGTLVLAPRDIPHGFSIGARSPARYLVMYTPAGYERFIVASSRPAQALTLPPDASVDLDAMNRFAAMMASEYGAEFVSDE